MLSNILKARFTSLKPAIFIAYFLLVLSSNTIFAETTIATATVAANDIKNIKITEESKNPKALKETVQGINKINTSDNPGHADSIESKTETTKEVEETKKAKAVAEEIEGTEEIKEIKKTKEGRRIAVYADPLPKTTSARDGITEKPFADNEQVNVVLSNRDINRVLVSGDKIQSMNGPAGLYTAKNDAIGSAYISLYGDAAFTIFVSTVKGHNFSLLVTPRSVAGRTAIFNPTTPSVLTARFEETESYQKALIALISSMINNEAIEDYVYSEAKKSKKTDFYGIANIKPIAFYSGSHLVGVISELKNKSKITVTLKPSYFYRPGVRAVALSCQTIAPSETGLLYQIISRE